jgi:hypothetical protein
MFYDRESPWVWNILKIKGLGWGNSQESNLALHFNLFLIPLHLCFVRFIVFFWVQNFAKMQNMKILPSYLFIYLPTYIPTYLSIYLPTYLCLTIYLPMYLPIHLIRYLLTYLWKKFKVKWIVIHIDKKIHWSSKKHVKWIWYILFYKVVWWFDGQDIGVGPKKPKCNPHYQHMLCGVYIYIYIYIYI